MGRQILQTLQAVIKSLAFTPNQAEAKLSASLEQGTEAE